jgi:hypothetical protein
LHHAAAFCHGLRGDGCDRRDWRHIIYKVGEGYAHLRMEGTADFASVAAPIVSDGLSFSKKRKRIVARSSDPFYVFTRTLL